MEGCWDDEQQGANNKPNGFIRRTTRWKVLSKMTGTANKDKWLIKCDCTCHWKLSSMLGILYAN